MHPTTSFLNRYECSKKVAWRADEGRALNEPVSYPKGNLQVWHVVEEGFGDKEKAAAVTSLAKQKLKAVKQEKSDADVSTSAKKAKGKRASGSSVKIKTEPSGTKSKRQRK